MTAPCDFHSAFRQRIADPRPGLSAAGAGLWCGPGPCCTEAGLVLTLEVDLKARTISLPGVR